MTAEDSSEYNERQWNRPWNLISVNDSIGTTSTSTSTTTRPTKQAGRSSAAGKSQLNQTTTKPSAEYTEIEIDPYVATIDSSKTSKTSPPDCDSNGENDVLGPCEVGRTSSAFLTRQNYILTLLTTIFMLMRTYWVWFHIDLIWFLIIFFEYNLPVVFPSATLLHWISNNFTLYLQQCIYRAAVSLDFLFWYWATKYISITK